MLNSKSRSSNLYHHCGYPNCHAWVQGKDKYCEKHHEQRQQEYQAIKAKRQQQEQSPLYSELLGNHRRAGYRKYNRTQRDAEAVSFYRSGQWKQIRDYRIAYDHYTCQCCGNNYQVNRLTADHVIMRKLLKPQQQLDWHNLWTLCNRCNAIKQQIEIEFQDKQVFDKLGTLTKNDWRKLILAKQKS